MTVTDFDGRIARASDEACPKKKRTNFRWPSMGISSPANRPDPDGPGGLGAEESGTERTGSTQDFLVAIQRGGRWAEVGQQYDSANDHVTRYFRISDRPISGYRTIRRDFLRIYKGPLALLRRRAVSAIMYCSAWSRKVGTGFRKRDYARDDRRRSMSSMS